MTRIREQRRGAWSVFWIALALYTATMCGLPDNPDAEVEFQTTSALARRGSFALGDTPEARAIVERRFNVVIVDAPQHARAYSWHGIGQALAAVPLYALGRVLGGAWPAIEARHAATTAYGHPRSEYFAHLIVGWRNPLLSAATAALIVAVAQRLGVRARAAWLAGLAYAACTFAWPQARSTLSDVQAAFCVFGSFAVLVRARDEIVSTRTAPLGLAALCGALAGCALLTRIAVGAAVAVLCVAAVVVLKRASNRRSACAAFGSALGVCVLLLLAANEARFGSPFESGYGVALASGTFFSYPVLHGLAGLAVAPGKGLLWMAPTLLLVPFFVRGADRLWLSTSIAMALAITLPVACTQTWHGAYTYGPRYLLPLLPFAWLGVAFAFERAASSRPMRWSCASLSALGLVVASAATVVDPMTHQDLAAQAARMAWPDAAGANERERDDARFVALQWDWRFSAPWAHWRIAAQRWRTGGDAFGVREVFYVDSDAVIEPQHERERGWRHLAWIDLSQRLGGRAWPAWAACTAMLVAGLVLGTSASRSR